MKLKNVTLELSSKPFYDSSDKTITTVCNTMFRQWYNLTKNSEIVSVLLWLADGSEILEYKGDLKEEFEWAYWCGCANHLPEKGNENEREKINTHKFPQKYREDVTPRTYGWIKKLIRSLKKIGEEITGKPIRVGAIFDNGPEFAISKFKYQQHSEIANADTLFKGSFVTCNSTLKADSKPYAAFPEGIPEGISLGKFMGQQFCKFSEDLGYDYIWLSNGMGFGTETWGIKGALFDKSRFYPENTATAAKTMLQFWQDFTAYWPGSKIETRGSNFSAGLEISTDAAPLKELYYDFKIAPPVNSPWAALNYNSGLELAAWMSHVAELPDERFPYRFYPHDPWFMNSPWLDRYGREPWDIYQPLSVSRIDKNGKNQTPNSIAFLTVDDTMGRMPEQVPDEVIPHIKQALRIAPDQAGPLVWVYPFDEYTELVRGATPRPEIVFNEDSFIGEAIQQGLPLNTVISTGNFRNLILQATALFSASIIIAPVTAYKSTKEFIANGGNVVFYGTLINAPEELKNLLGVNIADPISGTAKITCLNEFDSCENGALPTTAYIHEQFNAGGLCEKLSGNETEFNIFAEAEINNQNRIISFVKTISPKQKIGFVRSVLPCAREVELKHRGFDYGAPEEIYHVEKLMRNILNEYGWKLNFIAHDTTVKPPRYCISRNNNAFYYSMFAPNMGGMVQASTPYGAPVLIEMDTLIKGETALWHPYKSWSKGCRCFIKQEQESIISAKIACASYPRYHERWTYYNLKNADIIFFPPNQDSENFEAVVAEKEISHGEILSRTPENLEWHKDANGRYVKLNNITGNIYFTW